MLELKKVDRVVPDPRCVLRESDGGLNVLCVTKSARSQFREAKRIACQGRPATTVVNIQLGLIDSNALYSLFQLGNLV